jgi:CRISPR/Cas system-associated exonuclease Cas4 (RecB family)
MPLDPRVFVWEINDVVFCELKVALHTTAGDVRTAARERGRQVHKAVEYATTALPSPKAQSREEAERLHSEGATILMPEISLVSERLGLQGKADLLIWKDQPNLFELKTGSVPRVPNRRLDTLAFESDAAQALGYGILIEEKFGATPLLWIIYTEKSFAATMKTAASSPNAIATDIMKKLVAAEPVEVPFTAANCAYAEKLIARVRRIKQQPKLAHRSHAIPARCCGCPYKSICPEKLE